MTGIFRTLIPKLNKAYHRIKYTNSEHGIFKLEAGNLNVNITKGTFRDTYNFILANKPIPTRVWAQKWAVELNIPESDLNWETNLEWCT